MYFTNNFQKRRRIHRMVSALYVALLLAWFIIGDLGYFSLAFQLLIAVSLIWRTYDDILEWETRSPALLEKATLTLSDVPKAATEEAVQHLAKQHKWRVLVSTDQPGGYRVVMDTPITWNYLGDIISITVHPPEDGTRMITIVSHPKIPTIEFDDGRNRQHVETILSFLSAELQPAMAG